MRERTCVEKTDGVGKREETDGLLSEQAIEPHINM